MAAANSPLAPPNCSNNMLPKRGSGVPTFTVYISFFRWWYIVVLQVESSGRYWDTLGMLPITSTLKESKCTTGLEALPDGVSPKIDALTYMYEVFRSTDAIST